MEGPNHLEPERTSRRREAVNPLEPAAPTQPLRMPWAIRQDPRGGRLRPGDVLALQRLVGNRATQQALRASAAGALRAVTAVPSGIIARSMIIQRGAVSGAKQTALTADFGCAITGSKYADATADALIARKADLIPCVNGEVANLRALAGYAEGGTEGEIGTRLDILIRYNTLSDRKLAGFRAPPTPERVRDILDWIAAAPATSKPGLLKYIKDISLEVLHARATSEAVLRKIGEIMNGGGGLEGKNIGAGNSASLQLAHTQFGPGSGAVPAFTGWGKGGESSVDVNKRVHVDKHLLRLGNVNNPDPLEPLRWKRALGLAITRAKIAALLGGGNDADAYFSAFGDDFVDEAGASTFFNVFLPAHAAVANGLRAEFEDRYYTAVIAAAGSLARAVIGADGSVTKVMGYATQGGENVFIAGRLDDAGNATISSGYITAPGDDQLTNKNQGSIAWWITS